MAIETTYKFQLDKSSKKITCPSCGQKRAVRYMDIETNDFLPDQVCRCDRESSCGYHYTPKQYLTDVGLGYTPPINKMEKEIIEPQTDFLPMNYVEKSMTDYYNSSFAVWLRSLFGIEIANKSLVTYFVGRSKKDNCKACIFWQIDYEGKIRSGKIMKYDALTGKRDKNDPLKVDWVHTQRNSKGERFYPEYNLKQCFFGEHLLSEYPDKTVGIVESEKTAIVASILMPDIVWISTGSGIGGCKWKEWSVFKVLKDREIILFPDFGYINKVSGKTCFEEWSERAKSIQERMNCSIKVSKVLEDLPTEDREYDYDLADLLIKTEKPGGLAMSDWGYPAIWDLNFRFESFPLQVDSV